MGLTICDYTLPTVCARDTEHRQLELAALIVMNAGTGKSFQRSSSLDLFSGERYAYERFVPQQRVGS